MCVICGRAIIQYCILNVLGKTQGALERGIMQWSYRQGRLHFTKSLYKLTFSEFFNTLFNKKQALQGIARSCCCIPRAVCCSFFIYAFIFTSVSPRITCLPCYEIFKLFLIAINWKVRPFFMHATKIVKAQHQHQRDDTWRRELHTMYGTYIYCIVENNELQLGTTAWRTKGVGKTKIKLDKWTLCARYAQVILYYENSQLFTHIHTYVFAWSS